MSTDQSPPVHDSPEAHMAPVSYDRKPDTKSPSVWPGFVGVAAAGTWYGLEHFDEAPEWTSEFRELQVDAIEEVPFVPGLVDAMITANDVLLDVSTPALVGATAYLLTHWWKQQNNAQNLRIAQFGSGDLAGANELLFGNRRISFRNVALLGGTFATALAAGLAGGASATERDVVNGPLRSVNALVDTVTGEEGGEPRYMIFAHEEANLMGDSALDSDLAESLKEELDRLGVVSVPFNKDLPHITGLDENGNPGRANPAIFLSFPEEVAEAVTGHDFGDDCEEFDIAITRESRIDAGSDATVNGIDAQIGAILGEDIEQINREIGITSNALYEACYNPADTANPFGIGLGELNEEQIEAIETFIADNEGLATIAMITADRFVENNREFWEYNGTPLLEQQYMYLAAFLMVAKVALARNELEKDIHQLNRLTALQNVSRRKLRGMGIHSALIDTARITPAAGVIGAGVAAFTNAAEFGMRVNLSVQNLAVGLTLTALAKVGGNLRAVNRFMRETDAAEVIRS